MTLTLSNHMACRFLVTFNYGLFKKTSTLIHNGASLEARRHRDLYDLPATAPTSSSSIYSRHVFAPLRDNAILSSHTTAAHPNPPRHRPVVADDAASSQDNQDPASDTYSVLPLPRHCAKSEVVPYSDLISPPLRLKYLRKQRSLLTYYTRNKSLRLLS